MSTMYESVSSMLEISDDDSVELVLAWMILAEAQLLFYDPVA